MESFKTISRSKELGSTKSLLKKGLVPGIIYGKNTDSTKIAFENKTLKKLMEKGGFYSKIIDLDIDGKIEKVLENDKLEVTIAENVSIQVVKSTIQSLVNTSSTKK